MSLFGVIWSSFLPHFPAFGLNTDSIFPVFPRIWTEYGEILRISPYSFQMVENAGKMRNRITPNMDTFYAVFFSRLWGCICLLSQLRILLFHSKIKSKVLIKVNKKKKWNSTSCFACLIKIHLKYFCKSEVYFQLNRTSVMEL